MDRQNAILSYNGILFDHEKKWNNDMCYNMDEPQKHYSKWKKPVIKDHILCDSVCMKNTEEANL